MEGAAEINVLQYFHHVDKDITLAVNSWSSPFTDFLWKTFSDQQVWYLLYAVIAFFIIYRMGWKRGLAAILSLVLTVVLCDQTGNLVKNSVCRLRPCWDGYMIENGLRVLEGKGGQYGFFSAHAANAAGFAVCSAICFRLDKKHGYGTYDKAIALWAFMVGVSRVFVGKHFVGDVAVGFAVGVIYGLATGLLCRRLTERYLP